MLVEILYSTYKIWYIIKLEKYSAVQIAASRSERKREIIRPAAKPHVMTVTAAGLIILRVPSEREASDLYCRIFF